MTRREIRVTRVQVLAAKAQLALDAKLGRPVDQVLTVMAHARPGWKVVLDKPDTAKYPDTVDTPDYVAPTGQQLQPGATYRAEMGPNRMPRLRRIGLTEGMTLDSTRRELKRRNREYGRQSEEIGRLRDELDALRFRSGPNSLVARLYELRRTLGLARATPLNRVLDLAVEKIKQQNSGETP